MSESAIECLVKRFGDFNRNHPIESLGYAKGIHPDIEDIGAAMDEHAKQEAIAFADWLGTSGFEILFGALVWENVLEGRKKQYTTDQLYNLFKSKP